jgi:hypothetical protein
MIQIFTMKVQDEIILLSWWKLFLHGSISFLEKKQAIFLKEDPDILVTTMAQPVS